MSEGPEVRRTADRIAEALLGRTIEIVELRKRAVGPGDELAQRGVGTKVKEVRTHGKHVVLAFGRGLYLHNHMMTWGKWRTYARAAFDAGKARPPPRVRWRRRSDDATRAAPKTVAAARHRLRERGGKKLGVGRPCRRCGERIRADRSSSYRVTYWCPIGQPEKAAGRA